MRYRRNSDKSLRELEREYYETGDRQLLMGINRVRRRAGLPPHDDARFIAANNALGDLLPSFANILTTFIEVYLDLPMYLWGLNEDADNDEVEGNLLQQRVMGVIDEIGLLEREWREVSNETAGMSMGVPSDPEYTRLLGRYGLRTVELGPEVDVPEPPPGYLSIMSKHSYRKGFGDRALQAGIMFRAVCERAVRIFRKLLIYGAVNFQQILLEEPETRDEWDDSQLGHMDDKLDEIDVAYHELGDTTLGLYPSAAAQEMFSDAWYGRDK